MLVVFFILFLPIQETNKINTKKRKFKHSLVQCVLLVQGQINKYMYVYK